MKKFKELIFLMFMIMLVMANMTYGETTCLEQELIEKEPSISTRFSSIHEIQCALIVGSSKVDVEAVLHASTGDKTKIVAYLQKEDNGRWVTVDTITNTEYDELCIIDETVYTSTKYKFRVKVYGYVYDGGTLLEKATIYAY